MDILAYALINGEWEMADVLIECGAKITQEYSIRRISDKNPDIFDCLLEDINLSENLINTIIISIADNDANIYTITKILNKGYDMQQNKKYLHTKLSDMNVNVVKFLVKNGLELDTYHPLLFACMNDKSEHVDYYLEYGLQVNQEILDLVFSHMYISIIKVFIKHQVDLSTVSSKYSNNDLIEGLEKNGLNKMTLINLLLSKYDTMIDKEQMMDFMLSFSNTPRPQTKGEKLKQEKYLES